MNDSPLLRMPNMQNLLRRVKELEQTDNYAAYLEIKNAFTMAFLSIVGESDIVNQIILKEPLVNSIIQFKNMRHSLFLEMLYDYFFCFTQRHIIQHENEESNLHYQDKLNKGHELFFLKWHEPLQKLTLFTYCLSNHETYEILSNYLCCIYYSLLGNYPEAYKSYLKANSLLIKNEAAEKSLFQSRPFYFAEEISREAVKLIAEKVTEYELLEETDQAGTFELLKQDLEGICKIYLHNQDDFEWHIALLRDHLSLLEGVKPSTINKSLIDIILIGLEIHHNNLSQQASNKLYVKFFYKWENEFRLNRFKKSLPQIKKQSLVICLPALIACLIMGNFKEKSFFDVELTKIVTEYAVRKSITKDASDERHKDSRKAKEAAIKFAKEAWEKYPDLTKGNVINEIQYKLYLEGHQPEEGEKYAISTIEGWITGTTPSHKIKGGKPKKVKQ